MGLNASELQVGATAIAADITQVSIHTGDPGAAGTSNTTTAAKVAVTLGATGGNITNSTAVAFTGGAANGAATHVGFWATGGTVYRGFKAVTGDQTFNALGQYNIPIGDLDINGFSTA